MRGDEKDPFEKAVRRAEKAALRYILSRVGRKDLLDYSVNVTIKREGPGVDYGVDVSITLSPFCKENPRKLAEEAGRRALEALEEVLAKIDLENPAGEPRKKEKPDNNSYKRGPGRGL